MILARKSIAWAVLTVLMAARPAKGVIFYATGDPTYNTTAPTGDLAGSGWQWVGYWGGYQGTPIGPHHFLAAHHIGGIVGDPFVLNGVSYATTASFDDTASDLTLWEISGTFPTWAPLYRGNGEVGQPLVVFGRGLSRGTEVTVDNVLKGWQWGGGAGPLRWGQNTVSAVVDGGSYWGSLLYATFDPGGGPNEAHLASGDSSGPVFINDGTGWTLAGVAATVDGNFNTVDSGSGFPAAIFDARGLYIGSSGNWQLVTGPVPVPSGFYATQVSARTAWIDSIVSPCGDVPLLSPQQTIVFAILILGTGVYFCRSSPSRLGNIDLRKCD